MFGDFCRCEQRAVGCFDVRAREHVTIRAISASDGLPRVRQGARKLLALIPLGLAPFWCHKCMPGTLGGKPAIPHTSGAYDLAADDLIGFIDTSSSSASSRAVQTKSVLLPLRITSFTAIDFPAVLALFSVFGGLKTAYLDDKSSC